MKKIWNIIQYVIVFITALALITSIYRGDLYYIFIIGLCLTALITEILKNKLTKENKVATVVYWISFTIVLLSTVLDIFGLRLNFIIV